MQPFQITFLQLASKVQALKFGEFELKSGRISPYFFNAGLFNSGHSLQQLGECYAAKIASMEIEFDMLFGPAYKGIPLVSATAIALARNHDIDTPYAFNRKEAKTHGEGGSIVGAPLQGKVLILDDVITAGTAIRETLSIIEQHDNTQATGILVGLDRQEVGPRGLSAIQEIHKEFDLMPQSIVGLDDLITYIKQTDELSTSSQAKLLDSLYAYKASYGIS